MLMLVGLALFLVMITPVTVRIDLRLVRGAEALIALRLWGLGPNLRFRVEKTEQGHRVFRADRHGRARPLPKAPSSGKPMKALLRAARRGDWIRRYLVRSISLQRLDVALNVSFDDAARTALTAGSLQSLWRALPCQWRRRARLQVRPDFLGGQGGAQARCMVFFHLGTLLITAVMLLLSVAMERRAHPVHSAEEA